MTKILASLLVGLCSFSALAHPLEGSWTARGPGGQAVEFTVFGNVLTAQSRSYYASGEPSDYFFSFLLPEGRDVEIGEIVPGRLRSVDGLYGCLFDEKAELMLTADGDMKIHFPLLTFHREYRSVRENRGYRYRRIVDWTGWGWVERVGYFPIEEWRVISSQCVIDARNPVTRVLYR